jgi:diaminopimelate decarboxylase
MHHFHYVDDRLCAEGVDVERLAREVGTPFYCYSTATLERHYRVFAEAVGAAGTAALGKRHPARVFYAMKANSNAGVLATLARLGAGADTVSEGEVRRALAAGIPASAIVLSGVGKSEAELAFAVSAGVYQINVETAGELAALSRVAAAAGREQAVVFRVNPDVGAGGHEKITTGSAANKFGISHGDIERLWTESIALPGVQPVGLACHIGSQINDLAGLEAAFLRLRALTLALRAAGHRVERLDLGGGLAIPYELSEPFEHGPDLIHAYADMVTRVAGDLDVELGFEPGRLIVGNAGILVTRALYLNERPEKTFLVLDAAMNDLVRPAMYGAHHDIWPVRRADRAAPRRLYDVVGPICETGDTFAKARRLAEVRPGDLLAFMTAGAYGAVMASNYNSRLLLPEVLVAGERHAIVRPRQTWAELLGQDRIPDWLA